MFELSLRGLNTAVFQTLILWLILPAQAVKTSLTASKALRVPKVPGQVEDRVGPWA